MSNVYVFSIFFLQLFAAIMAGTVAKSVPCEGNFCEDITISPGCIIGPKAIIIAEAGPVFIGDGNIVEDYAQIINKQTQYKGEILKIGNGNIFQSSSIVESHQIGNGNIFKPNSYVGPWVTIGNGCIIGSGINITGSQHISDGLVVG